MKFINKLKLGAEGATLGAGFALAGKALPIGAKYGVYKPGACVLGIGSKVVDKTVYNIIRDYIAERTFDESGHYAVDEFRLKILDSLNNRIDNDGLFLENEITEEGNIPSDDLMCIQVSPGKAYVAGYDVDLDSTVTIDVEKPRDTQNVSSTNVPFEMGHLLRVNNVAGAAEENAKIELLKNNIKIMIHLK